MEGPTRVWGAPRTDGAAPLISPEDWEEIDRIFDQVLDAPASERAALLDTACEGRPLIRRQIELLLAASVEAQQEDFLAPLPHQLDGGMIRQFVGEEQLRAGERVGVYEIVRPIGKGGMGVVYLAERPFGRFKKPVALKVVKRGMDTDDILERFRFERQILAGLEHANIARLLDGGVTDDGLPYFVMEYVEGKPIDQYCDEKKLGIRQRIALFKAVCDAVQYAHRNLVVHRDLKPGNVLVSADGEVKLLDFGIAKLVDPESPNATVPITDASNRRMTPEYAAPEQVRGESATTATDVYALGVILYELLSGRRPYRFKTRLLTEIEEKICQEVPGRPSTAVLRAEGEETPDEIGKQRSATPEKLRKELAGDLDAITMMALKKEPELRYASAGELARDLGRYMDRRPVRAARDSATYRLQKFVERYRTTVLVAALGVFVLLAGAGTTWWQSYQKRQEAQRVQDEVRGKNATIGFINRIFDKVDPDRPQGLTFSATELIRAGLEEIESLDGLPVIQADLMNQIGKISVNAGLVSLADSLHQAAYAIQERVLGPDDPALSITLTRQGDVYEAMGDAARAEDFYLRAIALNPDNSVAHNNLGRLYLTIGRNDEGGAQLEKAIDLEPQNLMYRRNLGSYYYNTLQWDKAKEVYLQTAAVDSFYLAYANLATIYYFDKDYAQAARWYRASIQLNPNDYRIWGYYGNALYWRDEAGRAEAVPALREGIRLAEERLSALQSRDPEVLAQISTFYALLGDKTNAFRYVDAAAGEQPEDPYLWYDLASALETVGERQAAIRMLRTAIEKGIPAESITDDPGMASLRDDPEWLAR
ncbi:MAG: protein kinase [Rhodothermales bacterium]